MKVSEGRYPVHVVVGVAFAPPLAGVAAVAAILVLKVTKQKDEWTPELCCPSFIVFKPFLLFLTKRNQS